MEKEIIEIKRILSLNGMEKYIDKIVYMPVVPMLGIEKPYVIEEWHGVKVAKLISPSQD